MKKPNKAKMLIEIYRYKYTNKLQAWPLGQLNKQNKTTTVVIAELLTELN